MHKVPTLRVIANRPVSDRPYETTHRTASGIGSALADFLESLLGAVIVGLLILAGSWITVALILSLEAR